MVPQSALYETIHSQPEVARGVLAGAASEAERAAGLLAQARRVYLAGTGTSSHAAVVGEHLLRLAGADAFATTNFDFVNYPRPRDARDVLVAISHRGTKRYGTLAIAAAREAGMTVIGVTGLEAPMEGTDVLLRTAPSERSSTHSASYTGNLTALALLALRLGERNGGGSGSDVAALRDALERLPRDMEAVLAREEDVRPVAEALAASGRLVLMGAGPNAVTAREGALKVKESSYLVAEGFELETALHGGLQSLQPGDVAVVIAAQGPALERTGDLVRALDLLGARLLIVADERAVASLPTPRDPARGPTVIAYPAVPEALSPALAVIPLQLLAAYTAMLRGTNADSFRHEDPIFAAIAASYTL
ncbi:MAG: SIS domain-containing protein [Ktedonobacterales bacterium]